MDSSTYRHLMGQIKKSCIIPHYKFPGHNLICAETLKKVSKDLNNEVGGESDFLASFPCYRSFDYYTEASSALSCGSGLNDDANDLVKRKLAWEKKLKKIRVSNIEEAAKSIRNLRDDKPTNLSENLLEYINHFHSDPEPGFHGNYNWLYSGGTVDAVQEGSGAILVAADCFNSKPGFHLFKLNDTLSEIQYKSSCQLGTYSPVLQVNCQKKDEGLVICVRQKNYVTVFSVKECNRLSAPVKLWKKKVSGSKLLTSVNLKEDSKEFIITDSKYDVHLFDVETKRKVGGHAGRRNVGKDGAGDAWAQAMFGQSGAFLAFRNSFSVLDFRDFDVRKLVYYPSAVTNMCEEICSLEKCPSDPNYVYLGTSHSFLQVDVRKGKAVQKWTHLMKNPPQFVASVEDNGRDFLVLQSHFVEETLGVENERLGDGDDVNFLSRSLPCLLGGIKTSLKLARFHGVCLSPLVSKRFDFSVTGLKCLKSDKGDIRSFTGNSGGDVFSSQIKRKSERCVKEGEEDRALDTLRAFESHFENFSRRDFNRGSLEFVDMSPVLESLKNSETKPSFGGGGEVSWKYHQMFSPESLACYKDLVAQKVLHVWGYGDQEESDLRDATISADDKVREWMAKM